MPHLRFSRDKRGYENTYVVHAARGRGKAKRRILYWFRTPPNVRVGRAALDEDAIRVIEQHNPDLRFDWSKILASRATPAPTAPTERRRRTTRVARSSRAERAAPGGRRTRRRPTAPAEPVADLNVTGVASAESAIESTAQLPFDLAAEAAPKLEPPPETARPDGTEATDALEVNEIVDGDEIEPAQVPVTVYYGGADVLVPEADAQGPRRSPVEARLGSEALARLRARYSEILARIAERVGLDPARREEMRRGAEVLNPDAWVTEEEIAEGLQQFDARLGTIRRSIGVRRRRRSQRGGRRRRGRTGEVASETAVEAIQPASGPESVRDTSPATDELPGEDDRPD